MKSNTEKGKQRLNGEAVETLGTEVAKREKNSQREKNWHNTSIDHWKHSQRTNLQHWITTQALKGALESRNIGKPQHRQTQSSGIQFYPNIRENRSCGQFEAVDNLNLWTISQMRPNSTSENVQTHRLKIRVPLENR